MTAAKTAQQIAHLHVHSEYSLRDGSASVESLAKRAAELGQPALALTDHGVMSGHIEHWNACRREGLKPIFGCEVYFVDDAATGDPDPAKPHHLTLLAENNTGFRNLIKLSSAGFLEGLSGGKPTVDIELLDRYSEGLIALTGCLASSMVRRLLVGDLAGARGHAAELIDVFGPDDVYFEIQESGLADQNRANPLIAKLAAEFGRPLVATADVHYLRREDSRAHDVLLCMATGSTLAEPAIELASSERYLKSNEEMAAAFAGAWPGALESTIEIAERANVDLTSFKARPPRFTTPSGEPAADRLRELVRSGLLERYGDPVPDEAQSRAEHELAAIAQADAADYFLIVHDLVSHARQIGCAVGPGRGSAPSSIVNYALAITEIDPIANGLIFERFFDIERQATPDIDIDFSVDGRAALVDHLQGRYGHDSVANVIAISRLTPAQALAGAARVLGLGEERGRSLIGLLPHHAEWQLLDANEDLSPESALGAEYHADADSREAVDLALVIQGSARNASAHAAAIAITDGPITDYVPVQLIPGGDGDERPRLVTQYSLPNLEDAGPLKLDLLGLRALDQIKAVLGVIEREGGVGPDLSSLPPDDVTTFELLSAARSAGVFLFESEGMIEVLKVVRPSHFDDLVALVALYRPHTLPLISSYRDNKRSPDSIDYIDPRLREILGASHGVLIYQEQIMQIAQRLAGFSGHLANELRLAFAGEDREALTELREKFVEGCVASETDADAIDALWEMCVEAADYAFSRAHATAYALIGYRLAWLKAHYPEAFRAVVRDGLGG